MSTVSSEESFKNRLGRLLDKNAKYIFVSPAVLLITILLAFPVLYTFSLSFTTWSGGLITPPKWIALANYQRMITDTRFLSSVVKMLIFTVLAVGLEVVLGIALAIFFNREFPGNRFLRTIYLLPMIATPAAIALIWKLLYNPSSGLFNYLLSLAGLPIQAWLADRRLAMLGIIIVDVWEWTPLIMLITLAALAALPREPFEVALIDGANDWQILWYLTLPLIRPAIVVGALFRTIDALKAFDIIYALTQGGPGDATETLNIYAFRTAFEYNNVGYGSAILIFFYIFLISVALIFLRFRRVNWL
jgi:multiple sugar transport system permease protein